MTVFEREMRKIFGESEFLSENTIFTNKVMLSDIGDDLRAKVEFVYTNVADHYNALKLSIINRTEGAVDIQLFKFVDIIGEKSGYAPYIWDARGGDVDWYIGRPNTNDYESIQEEIEQYIGMYASQEMHYGEMTMGGM
jgi:hypothetical protein